MSRAFIVNPLAEEDMADARRWYDRQRPGLGFDFLDEVEATFGRIRRTPELFQHIDAVHRRALVVRFPYRVIYWVDDDQITVVAVWHTSRDPSGWQSRV